MLSTLTKILFAFILVNAVSSCDIGPKEMKCCDIMVQAGIKWESFGESVAHGIHSITIDHVKFYFDVSLPENNSIPTVNTDFRGRHILNHAPRLSNDNEIESLSMKSMDFVLSNNDNTNEFYISGVTTLEKLTHVAHMEEIWTKTKAVYQKIRKSPLNDDQLCECLTMEKEMKIIDNLAMFSKYFRNFGIDFAHTNMPKLADSLSWKEWKINLKSSMPSQKDIYHIAFYLSCKLRQYDNW